MAVYKRGRGFELGTTENKSSKRPERDSNPRPPDCESDALTTRPHCLLQGKEELYKIIGISLFRYYTHEKAEVFAQKKVDSARTVVQRVKKLRAQL